MDMNDNFLWSEKFRPRKVADLILPLSLKQNFQQFVDQKNIPNLLLAGGPGVGKTTVAKAMLDELDCDYIVINGSMNGNIDTLRTDILNFASSTSMMGGRKYVILDEADYLNPNSTQPALRNFMEEYSKNCGFILTCNFKNKIIEPLHSRCSVIQFDIPKAEQPKLAGEFLKRLIDILDQEKIEYDKKVLVEVIKKHYPDWRRIINQVQYYSSTGKIDTGILTNFKDLSLKQLITELKEKNFTNVRKWVAENSDMDSTEFYRKFYDVASEFFKPSSIPLVVLLIAKYSYQDAFVVDREINTAAFLVEVMMEGEFK